MHGELVHEVDVWTAEASPFLDDALHHARGRPRLVAQLHVGALLLDVQQRILDESERRRG